MMGLLLYILYFISFCVFENNKMKNVFFIFFFTSINSYTFVRFFQNMQRKK